MRASWLIAILGLLAAGGAAAGTHAPPRRIVSMNMCLDAALIELVPREHIVALSHYSRDPWRSTIAQAARALPVTYESAEEVVALEPDLVIASRHSAIATRNALRRVGIRFELFEVPDTVAQSLEQIRQLAALLHREAQGAALIARIEHAIAAARPAPGTPMLRAVVYQPGGLSAGAGTVTGELMRIAGFENVAERLGVRNYSPLPLESLLRAAPEVLLAGETSRGATSHAERVVRHRALRALESRMTREPFPARLLYCSGPTMIHALDALIAAREHAARAAGPAP